MRDMLLASNEATRESRELTESDYVRLASYFKLDSHQRDHHFLEMFNLLCQAQKFLSATELCFRLRGSMVITKSSGPDILLAFNKVRSTLAQRYLDRQSQLSSSADGSFDCVCFCIINSID